MKNYSHYTHHHMDYLIQKVQMENKRLLKNNHFHYHPNPNYSGYKLNCFQ